ncbi:MAG: steroid delta-isomerase [Crocinitomicaceae bacterium]|nr:steroid delta-isomerase [Crocinitomicaceae bacterium]
MKYLFFHLFINFTTMNFAQNLSSEQIVQSNLEAYNNRDLERFMSWFSDDIALYSFGEMKLLASGKPAIEKLYKELFEASPKLHSTILKRIVFENKVIDHESIIGRKGSSDVLEIVMIYEVKDGKIFKMTSIRK